MSSISVQPELLDKATILNILDPLISDKLTGLNIEVTVDSTNSVLQRLPLAEQHATVVLAEHQSSGRGRRGRQWHWGLLNSYLIPKEHHILHRQIHRGLCNHL